MGDDEERTEGIFYSAIAYEKLWRKPKPPLPELCTRPISRSIVYPDTSRYASVSFSETASDGANVYFSDSACLKLHRERQREHQHELQRDRERQHSRVRQCERQ